MAGLVGENSLDERNVVGEVFMQFCALNWLTVMNSWFQKKSTHISTCPRPTMKHDTLNL